MVIREKIKDAVSKLRLSNNDNPIFEAHQIIRYVLNIDATNLVLKLDTKIDKKDEIKIDSFLDRRISGEPLQYILGVQDFMSLSFYVSPEVLIPRSDTETLVEFVLDRFKNKSCSVLDIGTGTGCIPLSIAHYNKNAFVRGLDISEKALEIANKNAKNLNLSERATFEKFDILSQIPKGKYDIVTSNPPYIKTDIIPTLQKEVAFFEPHLALDGGDDGLIFYRRIVKIAPQFLNKDGLLIFEIGFDQGQDVLTLMQDDFYDTRILKDLSGNDRVVLGFLK